MILVEIEVQPCQHPLQPPHHHQYHHHPHQHHHPPCVHASVIQAGQSIERIEGFALIQFMVQI